ncbi:tryptophan 7-halogenase [Gilvimarinus japonicus]|uniref:Tryptophan 7-halogenase n=1 Tax=Gilvimarinus japonicus TaxID=1796469 RepID=A0ABV7HPD2_9GAMM
MSEQPLKHIAIVGQGVELWFSTAFLTAALKPFNVAVTCIELGGCANVDTAPLEALSPQVLRLLKLMQIGELDLIRQCRGGYSLGLDCRSVHNRFFVPHGGLGLEPSDSVLVGAAYSNYAKRGVHNLDALSVAATAAQQGKFAVAGADRPDLQALLRYGVHLETDRLVNFLKHQLTRLGATHVSAVNEPPVISLNRGQIASLLCSSGKKICADFWVDLSANGVLQEASKNVAMHSLLSGCSAVQVAQSWREAPPNSAARQLSTAKNVLHDTLNSARIEQSSLYSDSEKALADLCASKPLARFDWQFSKKSYCALASIWDENCLRLGERALQIPGPAFSRLSLIMAALVQFVDQLPDAGVKPALIQSYNRNMSAYINEAFSFNATMFTLVNKSYRAAGDVPSQSEVFSRTGRLLPAATDAVEPQQWKSLLYGLMGAPALTDITLDRIASGDVNKALNKLEKKIHGIASSMPSYADFLVRLLGR